MVRRHPAAAVPAGAPLSEPPESLDIDTAKAALEQVNKRLDAELALKTATETRALTLAGQCTTLLSAITAAVLVEGYGNQRAPLLAAGIAGVICLFTAVIFAYISARPQTTNYLPGRLPDELWDDLVAPAMKGPEFMSRLMMGLQEAMVRNELNQRSRARSLSRAIVMVKLAVPLAIVASLLVRPVETYLLPIVVQPGPNAINFGSPPTGIQTPAHVQQPAGIQQRPSVQQPTGVQQPVDGQK